MPIQQSFSARATTDGLGEDVAFGRFVPPLLVLRRPNLDLAAFDASEFFILVVERNAPVGIVRGLLSNVSRDTRRPLVGRVGNLMGGSLFVRLVSRLTSCHQENHPSTVFRGGRKSAAAYLLTIKLSERGVGTRVGVHLLPSRQSARANIGA